MSPLSVERPIERRKGPYSTPEFLKSLRELRVAKASIVDGICGLLDSQDVNRYSWGVMYGTLMRGAYQLPVREQTPDEVRKGILWERKNREESFARAMGLSLVE
ncbi:MAG: hypothetical protein HY368_01330 [Candidatus Aenigmarchaeota archaeon]|nr:hypothetical protein [Candidatus Aenigmarchaeota archaeon]